MAAPAQVLNSLLRFRFQSANNPQNPRRKPAVSVKKFEYPASTNLRKRIMDFLAAMNDNDCVPA